MGIYIYVGIRDLTDKVDYMLVYRDTEDNKVG